MPQGWLTEVQRASRQLNRDVPAEVFSQSTELSQSYRIRGREVEFSAVASSLSSKVHTMICLQYRRPPSRLTHATRTTCILPICPSPRPPLQPVGGERTFRRTVLLA